jgi:hypothetical protein
MVGLMQIMIYLFCAYLIYKGVEIFQIAFVSHEEQPARKIGIVIGVLATIGAVGIAGIALMLTEGMVASISNNMNSFPKF